MPPPRPTKSFPSSAQARLKTGSSLRKFSTNQRAEVSTSSNTSSGRSGSSFKPRGSSNSSHTGQSSNISSNSDAHKPRRKRRPKKKKQQVRKKRQNCKNPLLYSLSAVQPEYVNLILNAGEQVSIPILRFLISCGFGPFSDELLISM